MSNEIDRKSADDLQQLADSIRPDCAAFRRVAAETKIAADTVRLVSATYKTSDMPPMPEADEVALAYDGVGDAAKRLHTAVIRLLDRMELNAQILRGE